MRTRVRANEELKRLCGKSTSVPQQAPCTFWEWEQPYDTGPQWNDDGLHLSPEGYASIAQGIAPVVAQACIDSRQRGAFRGALQGA